MTFRIGSMFSGSGIPDYAGARVWIETRKQVEIR